MSIKPLDEIPMNKADKRRSYRQMIRDDIQSAINQGIGRFEFEGDYNWKYLAQYAREEADGIWRSTWYDLMRKAKKEHDLPYVGRPGYEYKSEYIKISSVKMADRIHVYCQIDFGAPDRICGKLIGYMIAEKEAKEKAVIMAQNGNLAVSIDDLGFSFRTRNCLARAGYKTIGDLAGKNEYTLMRVRNLGKKGVTEIIDKIQEFGLEVKAE